jgi:uncharacterized membrane protein
VKSTARIGTHPIHPMLVPYPIAFLSGAFGYDMAAWLQDRPDLSRTAAHLRTAGIVSALVSALPGLLDYLFTVPKKQGATLPATFHMLSNLGALGLFAAASDNDGTREALERSLKLQAAGTALLGIGGYLGGHLVYRHGIAVTMPDAEVGLEDKAPQAPQLERTAAPPNIEDVSSNVRQRFQH